MTAPVVVLAGLAGAGAGALLPLPAYRLSVAFGEPARTTCVHCGRAVPGVAGVALPVPAGPGVVAVRCGGCRTRLGPPAWLTALAGGVSCALVAAALSPMSAPMVRLGLPLYLALCVLGVLLGAIDLACKRLPDSLVLPALGLALAAFTGLAALTREWGALLRGLLGAAVLGVVFLVLYLIPGGGLGFGDVKLAVLLGLFLGVLGWRAVLLGGLLPWLINGPVALVLLLSGRAGRRTALPFGPAMLTGALVAVLVSAWVDVVGRTS